MQALEQPGKGAQAFCTAVVYEGRLEVASLEMQQQPWKGKTEGKEEMFILAFP